MLAGRRILVVEDEPIIGMTLEAMLEELGASAILAETVEAALAALDQSEEYAAAILDVNLRGKESYPVARLLTERRIPFIFASGYGGVAHPAEFAAVPTVDKPYRMAGIEAALAALWQSGD